jgi:hypothetical protein
MFWQFGVSSLANDVDEHATGYSYWGSSPRDTSGWILAEFYSRLTPNAPHFLKPLGPAGWLPASYSTSSANIRGGPFSTSVAAVFEWPTDAPPLCAYAKGPTEHPMQTEQRRRMEISSLPTAIHVHNRHARRLSNIRIDITRYAMRDLDMKSSLGRL